MRTRTLPRPLLLAVAGSATTLTVLLGTVPAAQAAPVDDFGTYQAQVSCDPVAKPGVLAVRSMFLKKFGGGDDGIVRACNVGDLSEHKEGRAWDWALNASHTSDRRIAARAIRWLTKTVDGEPAAHARQLGIMYAIWNHKMWRAYNPSIGWQPYTGSDPHTSHIHLSFTWNGAEKETSWWTGTVQPLDYGPCVTWVGEPALPWTAPNPVPCPAPLRRPVANTNGIYIAQDGETIRRVARWFHLTTAQVRAWNGWPETGKVTIDPGQKVHVTDPAA